MKTKLPNTLIVSALCFVLFGFSTKEPVNQTHEKNKLEFDSYPLNISGFEYVDGSGPSDVQSFQIIDLLALLRPYTITASAEFEVSLDPNTNFTNTLIIPNTIIDLGPVDVYIRLKGGLTVEEHSGTIHIFAPDPADLKQLFSLEIDENIDVDGRVLRNETVWDGTSWSHGTPYIETIVRLSDDFSTLTDGDLSAWSLNIDAGKTLTVNNNTFVKVKTDVSLDGQIIVETQGAFVQEEDSGTFTVNPGGSSTVKKTTSTLANWFDYTYWSSPVSGTTASQAFVNSNRKYWFNAQNYLDVLMETDNGNVYVPGHDDVDDNGDDWTNLNGADVLLPGVGYAATQSPSGFESGTAYNYNFDGPFNTGTIAAPIYYNGDNGDSDWNFIGNPYPCAIDIDAFFAVNSSVVAGSIYLWSHASLPDAENNGNEVYNFNSDDYAIINYFSGELAGGRTVIPNRSIPSGQGFFVQGFTNDDVVFNNSMRIADNTSNSQFFRTGNIANKLWLSLTSDNGVFNQVLVAYLDGATNGYDGLSYDTPRNLSSDSAAIIYTLIDNVDEKIFAIQGKAESSLNLEEVIPIGFFTSINEATLYTFTVAQFEGEFLNTNTIYLKDNYQNLTHNLTNSDYVFTSPVGKFEDRFELVFQASTLSVNTDTLENNITIIALGNNEFTFKSTNSKPVKTVGIYDIQGRKIYSLEGFEKSKTYNLPALSKTTYVAKLILEDETIVTKKMTNRL
ncbi:hypothetical protein DI383_03520 [Flavobacteriaceae bacterium LYZ1037]|nr:hypothetical protein DI383_03520 [Flavobacteriaceae bacterium LYZ1037]